jgi:hypothetical protein
MNPAIIIDVETTGLPKDGYQPLVVEIGACCVTGAGHVKNPIGFFVKQSEADLYAPEAEGAFKITKIDRKQVLAEGLPPDEASERLVRWVERVVGRYGDMQLRAFNQEFDFGFLMAHPWDIFARTFLVPGEDIMFAAMDIMGEAGALPPAPEWAQKKGQPYKWPKVTEALAFFNGRGHDIRWGSQAHRAQEDAVKEAMIAVAIEAERNGWAG